jgi:hypothetical protein
MRHPLPLDPVPCGRRLRRPGRGREAHRSRSASRWSAASPFEYAKAKVPNCRGRNRRWPSTPRAPTTGTSGRRRRRQYGPAARVGDTVQLTTVDIQEDRIVFAINGGFNAGKTRWFNHVQIGVGGSTAPISQPSNSNAPGGNLHRPDVQARRCPRSSPKRSRRCSPRSWTSSSARRRRRFSKACRRRCSRR